MEEKKKIVLAADHGGFELKQLIKQMLIQAGHDTVDVGCSSADTVDYPDFAERAVKKIKDDECQWGILICGSGIGMAIAANRSLYIRAANCYDLSTAKLSREHNNANVLCLGARMLTKDTARRMVNLWLETEFSGGRHQKRIDKFSR